MHIFALLLALSGVENDAKVGFDAGAKGWSINGFSNVTATGGNPDHRIHWDDFVDTFGLAARNSTSAAFLGDYTNKGPVTLSIDVQVDYIHFFGTPASRELVVILYDDDTHMGADPGAVWTSLGILPGTGIGWTTFSATVEDVLSDDLPAGWNGAGAEDPKTFEPVLPAGRTWTNVLAGVDRIEFTTFVPGFFFGFTNFNLSIDNVCIAPAASAWEDLGNGKVGTNGVPVLCGIGTLEADAPVLMVLTDALENSTCFLIVGLSQINAPVKGGILVPAMDVVFADLPTDGNGSLLIARNWPTGIPSGFESYYQYWVVDAGATANLSASNGLKATTP